MSPQRSVRTAALAAALAAAAWPHALFGQPSQPPASASAASTRPAPPLDIPARVQEILIREYNLLTNPATAQNERTEQARRLLSHQTGVSRGLLVTAAQRSAAPAVHLAVATALIDDPSPDATSIELLGTMLGKDAETTTAAARALAAAGTAGGALARVLNFINAPQLAAPNARDVDSLRAAAARGLGSATDRQAAVTLSKLLDDSHPFVRNAACDALGEMTGIAPNGRDVDAWKKWLNEQRNKTDAQFREAILSRLKRQPPGIPDETSKLLERLYQQIGAPTGQKPAVLKEMLTAPTPAERVVGARAYEQDMLGGRLPAAAAADASARVRDMIGDSSPAVREQVARTLGTLADKSAIDALRVQLAQELDAGVRVEIIRALARMGDPRVVPQLLQLLNDPSARVKAATADALRALGPQIRADAVLAQQVVAALRAMINNTTGDVRAAAVEALVPLADASTFGLFQDLLDPKQDEPTRLAALRGIAQLADPHARTRLSDMITADKEKSPRVRLAALDALAKVGKFDVSDALYNIFTNPNLEPDASVRERAWRTFQALLPTATDGQLQDSALRFRRAEQADLPDHPDKAAVDVTRRLAVLMELEGRDAKRSDPNSQEDLAAQRENIGEAYMQLKQPESAARYFRLALGYWLKNNSRPQVTEQVIAELMDALLADKKYADAAKFADQMITTNPELERIVGARLANRAEDLLDPPSPGPGRPKPPPNPREARDLATEGLKVRALSASHRDRLEQVLKRAGTAAPAAPAAPGTAAPAPTQPPP